MAGLLKLPSPGVLHREEVELAPITPARVYVLPAQMVAFDPALEVVPGVMVKSMEDTAAVQGPAPSGSLVVMVMIRMQLQIKNNVSNCTNSWIKRACRLPT